MPRDRSFPLLLVCFFLSGLAALVYETAWTREFAFVFGTSELAVATVLAAYMGGLAAGAALAGRYATRLTRPVLAYGLLELGIAVAALCVPFGVAASRWLYVALFGGREALPDAGGLATALFYLVCSFAILLVPTAMMGATLPLLARHAVHEEQQLGRRIGILYAVNTTGAVAGTLLAAFWLLPAIGLRATIAAAAGVNALVFLAAWALARRAGPVSASAAAPLASERNAGRAAWILPLILASGFVSFTYEVLWVRLVGHLVGSGVQAFATMLASFLAGIALGSAVAARQASSPRRAALGFAVTQLGIAALSVAAFTFVDWIPGLADLLQRRGIESIFSRTLVCMLTLFPSALCIGATFPFAVRVLARHSDDAGPASARVYAANTVGSIAGSVAAGFFLVPGLGFAATLAACAAVNLGLAAAAACLFEPRRPWLLATAIWGCVSLGIAPPSTPWRMLRSSSLGRGEWAAWGRVQYFGVGRSATVLLTDEHYGFNLRTNGLLEAGMQRPGAWPNRYPLTRWLGALPVLARPETRSLLLVGLGSGMAIEIVPASVERIDVIELEPEVLAANRSVSALRWRDPLLDPRVHVHLNDARNALLLVDTRFDAIVSQPSHPWTGGASHLYTQEFFELVRSRLAPGGVFVQWIGLAYVDEALFRSLLATIAAVFPHVQVYEPPPGGSVLFLASGAPLEMNSSVTRAVAAAREELALLGIGAPEDVLASLLLDDAGVRELAQGAPKNRDAHNRLQSRSDRLGASALAGRADALLGRLDPLVRALPAGTDVFSLLRRLEPKRAKRVVAAFRDPVDREVGVALAEIAKGRRKAPKRRLRAALVQQPHHEEARAALLRISEDVIAAGTAPERLLAAPLRDSERAVAAAWRARNQDPDGDALRALEASLASISATDPLEPAASRLRIQARLQDGDPERLREAVALAEEHLGDRADREDLLLRAEVYAAAREHFWMLETIDLLLDQLTAGSGSNRDFAIRARELARATPEDDQEIRWLRTAVLKRLAAGLGGRLESRPTRSEPQASEGGPLHGLGDG